jgi:hypothetical protein
MLVPVVGGEKLGASLTRVDALAKTHLPAHLGKRGKVALRRSLDVCYCRQDRVEDERTMEAL